MEDGKKRLAGDTAREANSDEVKELRREAAQLKEALADARARIEAGRIDHNQERPHSALGHLTPKEYVRLHQPAEARSG